MNSNAAGTTENLPDVYKKLAGKIGLGTSQRITRLWAMLCDESQAALVMALPGDTETLAKKTSRPVEDIAAALNVLFKKGVVFERERDGVVTFNPPKNFVQFHDASILWPDATDEFFSLWKEFMDEEYPAFLKMLGSAGLKPFMRVVPVKRSIQSGATVLPYEHAAAMIEQAKVCAVTECTCRKSQKKCKGPLEVCLQLDRGAEYAIKRGTGRAISKAQALEILDLAENAGLVHISENRSRAGNVLCNCCPCCCMGLEPFIHKGNQSFTAPSRYVAVVDAALCQDCMECRNRCPAGAVSEDRDAARVNAGLCIGCGLCSTTCPTGAITLKETRPPTFIP